MFSAQGGEGGDAFHTKKKEKEDMYTKLKRGKMKADFPWGKKGQHHVLSLGRCRNFVYFHFEPLDFDFPYVDGSDFPSGRE